VYRSRVCGHVLRILPDVWDLWQSLAGSIAIVESLCTPNLQELGRTGG